jgi:hypothetical protein
VRKTLWLDQLVSHREIIVGLTILSSADHPEAFLLSGFFSSFSKQNIREIIVGLTILSSADHPESKKASGWSADDKMVNPTMISLWLTSWSSQRVFLTMTSWSNVKGYILVVGLNICDKRLD